MTPQLTGSDGWVSRYQCDRLGDQAQPREKFGHVYPSQAVGVAANIAAAAEHA